MAGKVYNPKYPGSYYFDTFTFTTLGTSGHRGPDPTKRYANAPWNEGDFSIVDGQQQWTVPASGTYRIEAAGAYGAAPGRVVSGEVNLSQGQVVSLLVGQQPTPLTANVADGTTVGGGGGTFLVSGGKPLIVASGGDGTGGHAASFNLYREQISGINQFSIDATLVNTLDNTGNRLTAFAFDLNTFAFLGTRLFEWSEQDYSWSLKNIFVSQTCLYIDDTIAYTTDWFLLINPYSIRINEFAYGTWNLLRYTDITSLFSVTSVQVSQDGTTLLVGNYNTRNVLLYRRVGTTWVFTTEITGENFGTSGTLSENGNRFVSYSQDNTTLYVRDYPWSTRTDYSVNENPYSGCISPDGSLYVAFGNVYSLTDGSVVFSSLPGYILQNNSAINISKDNKTIMKNVTGIGLQIIKYPFTSVSLTISALSSYSFSFQTKLNQDATIFTNSAVSEVITYSTLTPKPHSTLSQPYGAGNGINGAGYFSNGLVTSATFKFLKPEAYVDGGFGNSFPTGVVPEQGGFGGGQSPVTTGVSGGGGYTGSPGYGVYGATCYADPTVTNFTDLGAASNTAGYVTVSLIDPEPIKETWSWDDEAPWDNINTFQSNTYTVSWSESLGFFIIGGIDSTVNVSKDGINWSQTIVTNFQTYSVDIVSASNKPILVWGDHTSNDGTVWTYNNLPITGYSRMVYLNGMFLSSANQPEYGGYGLYTSTDGFTWTPVSPSFQGMVRAYNNSVYVGIDSIVTVYGGTLIFSNDLNTWTQTNINSTIYDVAYGNGVFVAVGDGAYTSVDGQTWNQSVVPDGWIPENTSIIFGNGVFIVFSHYTNNNAGNVYTSVDGSSWVFESSYTGYRPSITYSPSLNYFCSIKYNETPQITLEGRYFITSGHYFKYPILDFAWSTELKTMVVMSGKKNTTSPVYVYTSLDEGNTWEEKLLFEEFAIDHNVHVVWSTEIGKFFIYLAKTYTSLTIFTSTDGLIWNSTIEPLSMYGFEFTKPFWCKKKGIFTNGRLLSRDGINWYEGGEYTPRSVVVYSEKLDIFISSSLYPAGTCGYSYDGSHWTNLPYTFTSVAWSPSLGLFIAVETQAIVSLYVSADGISWNLVSTLSTFSGQFVTWSEELQKFYLLFAYPFATPKFTLQESSDGYTWTTLPTPKINTGDYTYNFSWVSGLDHFVIQSNENLKGLTFSPKAIKQF